MAIASKCSQTTVLLFVDPLFSFQNSLFYIQKGFMLLIGILGSTLLLLRSGIVWELEISLEFTEKVEEILGFYKSMAQWLCCPMPLSYHRLVPVCDEYINT